jgi:hypothetical protein
LWDIKLSAEWILKFVSVHAGQDGSSTGQIVRRAENCKVQDDVYKTFLQKRSQNQTLSGPVLCEKALIFARFKYIKELCVNVLFVRK